jgi:hypothetical protein
MEMEVGEEQSLAVELDSVRDANVADAPARTSGLIACISDSWVPTLSSTASAPIPFILRTPCIWRDISLWDAFYDALAVSTLKRAEIRLLRTQRGC